MTIRKKLMSGDDRAANYPWQLPTAGIKMTLLFIG
jgi:hypothetical protein